MKIPEGLSCPVTPDMAYANGVPEIPKDWEFVSFGRVMPGRAWLSSPEGHPVEPGPGTTLPVGPRIIVRRKPEPKPKPASCPGNAGIMPTPHCPCTDKCCFCHYEEQLPSKQTRARRFEFLDSSGILNGRSLYWMVPQELLREVKPITREQVIDLCNWFEGGGSAGIVAGLRELGIEVED